MQGKTKTATCVGGSHRQLCMNVRVLGTQSQLLATASLAPADIFPARRFDHSVVSFPRVSGKKSTKRTKSINGPLYVFRGRINTEVMEVENVEDGTGRWCLLSLRRCLRLYAHSLTAGAFYVIPHNQDQTHSHNNPNLSCFTSRRCHL